MNFDEYKNIDKYPADKEGRKAWQRKQNELECKFKVDALRAVGLGDHRRGNKAYELAWSLGHANGLHDVYTYLDELAALLLGDP